MPFGCSCLYQRVFFFFNHSLRNKANYIIETVQFCQLNFEYMKGYFIIYAYLRHKVLSLDFRGFARAI